MRMLVGVLLFSGILYLINLPFMALAFNCPSYRDRFRAALRLPKDPDVPAPTQEPG